MKLGFVGDVCVNGSFLANFQKDEKIFSTDIQHLIQDCEYVVVNLEGATTDKQAPKLAKNTSLKNPENLISWASQYPFVYNLANNHILDYGEDAFRQTMNSCKNHSSRYFGQSIQPCIVKNKGISIALFSCVGFVENARLINTYSNDFINQLEQEIQRIKHQVDFIFLNYHGGEEFSHYPSPVKRKRLKKMAKIDGVDAVIAHHSHTVQGVEYVNNVPIFYSIGNFVFDLEHHRNYEWTDFSVFLEFEFEKDAFQYRFIPVQLKNGLVSLSKNQDYAHHLSSISDFSNYKKIWRKEANRILFRAENPNFTDLEEDRGMQKSSILKLLGSREFYAKLISILKNPLLFSIYWNALLYKYFK